MGRVRAMMLNFSCTHPPQMMTSSAAGAIVMSLRHFAFAIVACIASAMLAFLATPLHADSTNDRVLQGLPFFNFTGRRRLSGTPMNINGKKVMGVPLHMV